jgi:hypothetical protein
MDNEFESIESDFKDFDDSEINDFKINPTYYLHTAILKSQECLMNPNLAEGLQRFQFMVLHLESLCKASSMLVGEQYYKDIKEYMNEDEYKNADKSQKSVLLAIKKQELLTTNIFRNRAVTTPIKLI